MTDFVLFFKQMLFIIVYSWILNDTHWLEDFDGDFRLCGNLSGSWWVRMGSFWLFYVFCCLFFGFHRAALACIRLWWMRSTSQTKSYIKPYKVEPSRESLRWSLRWRETETESDRDREMMKRASPTVSLRRCNIKLCGVDCSFGKYTAFDGRFQWIATRSLQVQLPGLECFISNWGPDKSLQKSFKDTST